jgi:ABC-type phosphate transport system substrate-binding protein
MGLRIVAAVLVVVVWAPLSSAQGRKPTGFVVVVNKANPVKTMPLVDLRRIFMKQTRMWPHAEPVVPVDWDSTSEMRQIFCERVLNKSVREMSEYWVQQTMTQGVSPPSTQRSALAILRYVASVPGAISYVPSNEVDNTVNIIRITGLPR